MIIIYSYSYIIEFTHQTCMKKVHDNVHKRYSDKTKLTIKTNLLKIKQAPVNKGTFIGTGGILGYACTPVYAGGAVAVWVASRPEACRLSQL